MTAKAWRNALLFGAVTWAAIFVAVYVASAAVR